MKNIFLLILESNLSEFGVVIVKLSGKNDTAVPTAWLVPTKLLSTLKILSLGNTPRTLRVSVPIPMLLPIAMSFGIGET